jgi:hypothetical protein
MYDVCHFSHVLLPLHLMWNCGFILILYSAHAFVTMDVAVYWWQMHINNLRKLCPSLCVGSCTPKVRSWCAIQECKYGLVNVWCIKIWIVSENAGWQGDIWIQSCHIEVKKIFFLDFHNVLNLQTLLDVQFQWGYG